MKFRKKPVVIEAEQFLIADESLPFADKGICQLGPDGWIIETLEGPLHISDGDWIIKGVQGEFYPCKPDIFKATYEIAEEGEMKHLFLLTLGVMILMFPVAGMCAGHVLTFDCTNPAEEINGAKIQINALPAVDVPLVSTCGSDPVTKVVCTDPKSKTICYPEASWPTGAFSAKALVLNIRDSSGYSLPLPVPGVPSSPGSLRSIVQ